ncbi:MAG: DNA-directed RNA polymerase subunit K [Nanoarchaeota archaeon]
MIEKLSEKFTKYEIARILGARSLQLAMDAPVLLKLTKEEEEELNYDSLRIAEKELESGVLPITVRRPLPKRSEKIIKKLTDEEIKEKLEREKLKAESKDSEPGEEVEEQEIAKEGEIMEMAKPEDEEETEEVNEVEEM